MRLSDYIISRIYALGTDTLFSVSGRGILFLTDALAKHKKINNIATHHEQAAGFSAVAYAQKSNKLGACLVSTGCGSTNAITAVLSAWQDNIPCIFISGNNTLNETTNFTKVPIRTYGQQEADIIPLVKSITKYSVMITKANDIVEELDKAIKIALEGRKGPVWIDVPLDIQSAKIDFDESLIDKEIDFKKPVNPNQDEIDIITEKLNKSKRPVVLIGSGIKSSESEKIFQNFVEKNKIPVVFSNSACDIYGSSNEFSVGSIGAMGASRAGNFALQNSDLVLVIGNRLSSYATGNDFCKFAREAEIVVVDIDPGEFKKETVKIDQFIHSDAKVFLEKLLEIEFKFKIENWLNKCLHWKKIFSSVEDEFTSSSKTDLYELCDVLSDILPDECSLVTDSGYNEVILPTNIKFKNGQNTIHPISQGAMGFALAGAVGAYYAKKDNVFVVVGDGSIMMNLQELQTIKHNNIPAKIIVINNNVYGIIRRRQKDLFRRRTIGVDPTDGVSCPNFEKIATAFDIKYLKIDDKETLRSKLENIVDIQEPILIEIMCREDQSYIEVGTTKNIERKYVSRPLEDQIPFLDRDIFLNEMIINPIDQ
jgi:acetolactate synthase-1/2/3 large subunit